MYRYLLVISLSLQLNAYGQIDPEKVDSLARTIDSSANARQLKQDSAIKIIDSNYRSGLNEAIRNSHNNLTEQKIKAVNGRKQIILQIIIGVALLIVVLFVAMFKRRRIKKVKNN